MIDTDCVGVPTQNDLDRMDRWLGGEEVEGFPIRSQTKFNGYYTDQEYLPTDWASLAEYRRKKRLLSSERQR